jgi:hypothetical protein
VAADGETLIALEERELDDLLDGVDLEAAPVARRRATTH